MQLNLLYVQARDAILDGTHPVTQAKGKNTIIQDVFPRIAFKSMVQFDYVYSL